jgi:anaerobic selenocysteine-containing dehydrogenase
LNYGMQRVKGGGNAVRAIACLPALTGGWRHRAGGAVVGQFWKFSCADAPAITTSRFIGWSQTTHDQYEQDWQRFVTTCVRERWLRKLKLLVVYNSNPVAVAARSGEVIQGFAREDLFTVVLEHFQTDTADYADYILPATTQLEHWDIHASYGHTDILLNRPAIAPMGSVQNQYGYFSRVSKADGVHGALLLRR